MLCSDSHFDRTTLSLYWYKRRVRWRWKQGNTNYIDGYDLEENDGYLNQDDPKPLKYVDPLGFTMSLKVKPIRFDGITCREWNTLSQDIWAELYFIHKRISKFKRNLETFQSGLWFFKRILPTTTCSCLNTSVKKRSLSHAASILFSKSSAFESSFLYTEPKLVLWWTRMLSSHIKRNTYLVFILISDIKLLKPLKIHKW